MIDLRELIRRVSLDTGVSQRTVSRVSRSLMRHIREGLAQDGHVRLDSLGTLLVCLWRQPGVLNPLKNVKNRAKTRTLETAVQLRVSFKKSPMLKQRLREEYGGHNAGR